VFDIGLLAGEVPYLFACNGSSTAGAGGGAAHRSERHRRGRSTKVTGLEQGTDHVDVTVINAGGETETIRGRTSSVATAGAAPCGGWPISSSRVSPGRAFHQIGTSFDFGATGQRFCTRNYFSDPHEWLNLFKVKGNGPPGIWRGIMPALAE
jgi:3-(3-hydroxy-phenyl)propionate hydroxylase